MMTTLITIPYSHFCEKARWALDACGVSYVEDAHLPVFHRLATLRARAHRTVPALVDGRTVVPDSTEIIAWADRKRPGMLLPPRDPDRADALGIEDYLDRQLGPATRRWVFFHLLDRKELVDFYVRGVPRWQAKGLRATWPLAIRLIRRDLKIHRDTEEQARAQIDAVFGDIGGLLGDGRRYLIGDRFTVADLTFAALAAPVLLPEDYGVPLPPLEAFDAAARAQIETWRRSPPGQFALRLYAEHRHAHTN
jgi:glutathione S-transferase